MAWEIPNFAESNRAAYEMGRDFGSSVRDAVQERAWRKESETVMAQVQAQLSDLRQDGMLDQVAYEEALVRAQSGDDVDGAELASLGRKALVSAFLYNQRSMEIVNSHILGTRNPLLQQNLGHLASTIQQNSEAAMRIGEFLNEEGRREEEAKFNAEKFAEEKHQFDVGVEQGELDRQSREREGAADRSVQYARIGVEREQLQLARERAAKEDERDDAELAMRQEEHDLRIETLKAKKPIELLKDNVELYTALDDLVKAGASSELIKSVAKKAGVEAEEWIDAAERGRALSEETSKEIKKLERLKAIEAKKPEPDQKRMQGLTDQIEALEEAELEMAERDIERRNRRLDVGEAIANAEAKLAKYVGGFKELRRASSAFSISDSIEQISEQSTSPAHETRSKTKGEKGRFGDIRTQIRGDQEYDEATQSLEE